MLKVLPLPLPLAFAQELVFAFTLCVLYPRLALLLPPQLHGLQTLLLEGALPLALQMPLSLPLLLLHEFLVLTECQRKALIELFLFCLRNLCSKQRQFLAPSQNMFLCKVTGRG